MIPGLILIVVGEGIIIAAVLRWHRACVRALVDQAATLTIRKDQAEARCNALLNPRNPLQVSRDSEWLAFTRSL